MKKYACLRKTLGEKMASPGRPEFHFFCMVKHISHNKLPGVYSSEPQLRIKVAKTTMEGSYAHGLNSKITRNKKMFELSTTRS